MSLQSVVSIIVVVFVVGWFAAGTHYNVRKGEESLRWLQEGLPLIGGKTTMQWLGSSVVQLKIQEARRPFHDAEVLIVLEPRDVAPLWALARLRGRRDLLVIRGALEKRPRFELEAFDAKSWRVGGNAPRIRKERWSAQAAPAPLTAYMPQPHPAASQALEAANFKGSAPVRLAVHYTDPNLEVQWRLDQVRQRPAREVLQTVRRIAETV